MNNKKVSREELLNGWLKYHNTTVEEVVAKHPKEVLDSPEWFKLYPCTQAQYKEWVIWGKNLIKQTTKCSKVYLERQWPWIDLDSSPYVIKDEN
jgi:hypothetical protein